VFSLLELIPPPPPRVRIVDVGAQRDPCCPEVYLPLVESGCASVVGFEPLAGECERLNAAAGTTHKYLPYAVAEGGPRTLRICSDSKTSSLYEPNQPLLACFNNLANLCQVVERVEASTVALDDLEEACGADFLKLDVQGAEADVLRGAGRLLEDVLIVHTEVEFVPLYKDQPLFGDVDALLRARGFLFHTFMGFASRAFRPMVLDNDPNRGLNQYLWSEAVYVKSFVEPERLERTQALKLALILHDVYRSVDLAAWFLRQYDAQLALAYMQKLAGAGRVNKNVQGIFS
jgi:FkbM family methyltransferase